MLKVISSPSPLPRFGSSPPSSSRQATATPTRDIIVIGTMDTPRIKPESSLSASDAIRNSDIEAFKKFSTQELNSSATRQTLDKSIREHFHKDFLAGKNTPEERLQYIATYGSASTLQQAHHSQGWKNLPLIKQTRWLNAFLATSETPISDQDGKRTRGEITNGYLKQYNAPNSKQEDKRLKLSAMAAHVLNPPATTDAE